MTEIAPTFESHGTAPTDTPSEYQKILIPPNRLTPLRNDWLKIYTPIVSHLSLLIRFNTHSKCIELKSTPTTHPSHMQKALDFIRAYTYGFDIDDCAALLRLDDLYIESFEVKDVKTLHGDHLSRAIGRIAGKDGKTRYTIENTTRTRIVLADSKVYIMGTFQNIKLARDAICNLILGSPPGKVYSQLRNVASRMKEKV